MSRSTWSAGSLGFVLGLACSAGFAVAAPMAPLTAASALVVRLADHAYALDRLSDGVQDRSLRAQMKAEQRALSGDLGLLQATIDQQLAAQDLRAPPHRPPAPRAPVVPVTGDAELQGILAAMEAESFGRDQLAVLASAAPGRHFTSGQVVAVMDTFTFDSDRVEAATLLYPLVVDPQNWYVTTAALTFSSSKETLRSRTH
ncbi:MAG: DUF4476 domain-containing protein [Alphaproteobacteria bacterium]|nr:DUF4476 domain-containing protein [Alphaproteobacteria bacterium]